MEYFWQRILHKEKQRVEWYRNHNAMRQEWGRKILTDKNKTHIGA